MPVGLKNNSAAMVCPFLCVVIFPVQKQAENKAYNLGDFLVEYPKLLVVRGFDIAVRGFGGSRPSTHAFSLNTRFHFFLMSFAYHSDMILIKGTYSNVSGFLLSMPLLTAKKRILFRLEIPSVKIFFIFDHIVLHHQG